jgi:hypothetical protein
MPLVSAGVADPGANVDSVFGRTGAVVAATNDYTVAQVNGAAPLASPTLTGTVTVPAAAAGTSALRLNQVSPVATVTSGALATVQLVSGTGTQISATRDAEAHTPVTFNDSISSASCAVALSPDNVTYSALYTLTLPNFVGAVTGNILPISVRVPAGWYLKLTVSNATLGVTSWY